MAPSRETTERKKRMGLSEFIKKKLIRNMQDVENLPFQRSMSFIHTLLNLGNDFRILVSKIVLLARVLG